MPTIDIPSTVSFYIEGADEQAPAFYRDRLDRVRYQLCFKHAVQVVVTWHGHVRTELVSEFNPLCNLCLADEEQQVVLNNSIIRLVANENA